MGNFRQHKQSGMTVIELIVALAIVATLAAFATSGASAAINASRASNSISSLFAALTNARSFAASGGVDVVLCPSVNGSRCVAGYHWENGWIRVIAATHTGRDRTADEPILLRQEALPKNIHLITSAGRTRVRFQPSGGNAGSNVTFTLCDGRGPGSASAYAMANNGNLPTAPVDPAYVAQACTGL
jgi:type IV fimbrial biogenesis protein FimT